MLKRMNIQIRCATSVGCVWGCYVPFAVHPRPLWKVEQNQIWHCGCKSTSVVRAQGKKRRAPSLNPCPQNLHKYVCMYVDLCMYVRMYVCMYVWFGWLVGFSNTSEHEGARREGRQRCEGYEEVVFHPHHFWVQNVQIILITAGGIYMFPTLSVPTNQPAFIEWQSKLHMSPLPSQMSKQNGKRNH